METTTYTSVPKTSEIIIDGNTVNENPAAVFRGLGCVTGNGSSRLLMDYKANFPEVYGEIVRQLFAPDYGAGLSHIKIELGADVNSAGGTEPCVKRSETEVPDVTRGAGFMLAADAKRINPDLTLDLIRRGEPHWVSAAFEESKEAGFAARYQWFYETLVAAYMTYGLTFDYISADANEPEQADTEWLIYFAKTLRAQENPPYAFSAIKLVASDEAGTRTIAQAMLDNEELRNAIDVIGLHYTTHGDDNTQLLHDVYGKEIWYSEGIAPCNVPEYSCRVDGNGMSGANGPIDVANRIINSYVNGRMVMYEFLPAVCGNHDGSDFSPRQLLTANSPWSGHYKRDVGFWIAAHFTRFAKHGWQYVDGACYGDGEEDHTIWNTTHNFLTLVSPDKKDMTVHISNDSDMPRSYLMIISHLPELPHTLHLVETAGNENPEQIDRNWFRWIDDIHMHPVKGDAAFPVVVKPHSLLTITTKDVSDLENIRTGYAPIPKPHRLELPYCEQFAYNEKFLSERGNAPLYMTDLSGAFEVIKTDEGNVLQQMMTKDMLPRDLRCEKMPAPLTCFGDDTWCNYKCSTSFRFASEELDNYAGFGMRYNSAVTCSEGAACGIQLKLYTDGKWELCYMESILEVGKLEDFQYDAVHQLQLIGIGALIMAFVDGHSVAELKTEHSPMVRSGRMCLQSGYYTNRFLEVKAEPIPMPMPAYVYRLDCMSKHIQYVDRAQNGWMLDGMADFRFYNRTCAKGEAGSELKIEFCGNGISLLGKAERVMVTLMLDGKLYAENVLIENVNFRESFYMIDGLSDGTHTLRLLVVDGALEFDAAEVLTDDPSPVYNPTKPIAITNLIPTERRPVRHASNIAKAAIPIAGIAATGLAVAFTVGAIMKKKKKSK